MLTNEDAKLLGADLRCELNGPVAVWTIANPPLNLLTLALRRKLLELAITIGANDEVRAVLLVGDGTKAFCAGSDIREFSADDLISAERARSEHECYEAIESMPQPVIAVLRGHVLGGGLELAMACDLRVAADEVVLAMPEVKLGVFPSGGGTQRLPRLVGASRAKELLFLGSSIGAAEAQQIGLVDKVLPASEVMTYATRLAHSIADQPRLAIQAIKRAVNVGLRDGPAIGQELEEALIVDLHHSHDAQEGVMAFLEKRTPVFEHR